MDWQSIETAPKDRYLLLFGTIREGDNRWGVGCYFAAINRWCWGWGIEPTHWQNLTTPPGIAVREGNPFGMPPQDANA